MTTTATTLLLVGVVGTALGPVLGAPEKSMHERSCQYEGRVYAEGESVKSGEPCLNCSCVRGSLVCYLRVCPRYPDPPPPGCVLLQRREHCCSMLVCDGDPQKVPWEVQPDIADIGRGCIANGTLYAEGSAMASSSLCDYCYCIRGHQRCVQPHCLLPLEGCKPDYTPHACCPTRYDCSEAVAATTTAASATKAFKGCEVDGKMYPEGEMVQAIASSQCENCFCVKGRVQCVPLACAPPLQGCTPIIVSGECCPSRYNCSAANKKYASKYKEQGHSRINIHNKIQNTASLTIVYDTKPNTLEKIDGKLVRSKLPTIPTGVDLGQSVNANEGRSNREMGGVTSMNATDAQDDAVSETTPVNLTEHTETTEMETTSTEMTTMTSTDDSTTAVTQIPTTERESTTTNDETTMLDEMTTQSNFINETSTNEAITTSSTSTYEQETANTAALQKPLTSTTVPPPPASSKDTQERTAVTEEMVKPQGYNDTGIQEGDFTTSVEEEPITMQTDTTFMTLIPTTVIMPEELDVMNVTLHKNVSIAEADNSSGAVNGSQLPVRAIPPDIEAILNITHKKDEDYEYDYSEPSLPPSLPGVRIIPFVAADAVVEDKNNPTVYPKQDKQTDNPAYYTASHPNLFSPPVETEGGFVPREPILDGPFYESKFDVPYHTTGMNIPAGHIPLDITSGTIIPPSITMLPKTEYEHCLNNGREYRHGELVSSTDVCVRCVCYYGEVLCQAVKCPAVQKGCRRLKDKEHGSCCGRVICPGSGDSPTVVLDRIDVTPHPQILQQPAPHLGSIVPPITVADGVVTPDPFRDVIRTEPAPDLPSLIGDIMPYLMERHTSTSTSTTTASAPPPPPQTITTTTSAAHHQHQDNISKEAVKEDDDDSSFSFDSVLQFFFSEDSTVSPAPPPTTTTRAVPTTTTTATYSAAEMNRTRDKGNNVSEQMATVANNKSTDLNTTQFLIDLFNVSVDDQQAKSTVAPSGDASEASSVEPHSADPGSGPGLLKLAGCNIYGRMYRVGRIISELSGPCLECMCTEVGVQCRALDC